MAITERYVTTTGAGAHDGSSEANAWSFSEAVTGRAAGDRLNVKTGTHTRTGTDSLALNGTTTSPVVWRGYNSVIGDLDAQGVASGGALDTTNFPVIAYNATFFMDASAASFENFLCLKFTGNVSNPTLALGADSVAENCDVSNTSANTSAKCIDGSTRGRVSVINCSVVGVSTTTGCAIRLQGSASIAYGNRVTCSGGAGFFVRDTTRLIKNTVFNCGTHGIASDSASATTFMAANTIYGCAGNGIEILTATTGAQTIVGNHITDNTGWGINFNTSTCRKYVTGNRFRDNVAGKISGGGDWETGSSFREINTDTGGAATDYTNAGSLAFSLILTAPGFEKGVSYKNNVGANGTPQAAGGGGLMQHPGMAGGMRG